MRYSRVVTILSYAAQLLVCCFTQMEYFSDYERMKMFFKFIFLENMRDALKKQ